MDRAQGPSLEVMTDIQSLIHRLAYMEERLTSQYGFLLSEIKSLNDKVTELLAKSRGESRP